MDLLDDLFEMRSGYVLDFTDLTFGQFFRAEVRVNIDEPRFALGGTSKAKRLRYFLQNIEPAIAARALVALWEYREVKRKRARREETVPNAEDEFWAIAGKLGAKRPQATVPKKPTVSGPDPETLKRLSNELVSSAFRTEFAPIRIDPDVLAVGSTR